MNQVSNSPAEVKSEPVVLKTGFVRVAAKSIDVAAEGLFYNKV